VGSRSERLFRGIFVGALLSALVALGGSPAVAQEGDICQALTPEELTAAVPGTYDAPGSFPGTCQWHGTSEAGDAIDVILYAIPGTAADLGLAAAGGEETSIAGHVAYTMTDPSMDPPGGLAAVDTGASVLLLTVSTGNESVDLVAAAKRLAEVAIGRIESLALAVPIDDTLPDENAERDSCALFSADELSDTMGATLSAFGDGYGCRWDSSDGSSSVSVAFDQAGLTTLESMFAGGEHITLGDQPAYQVDLGFPGFAASQVSLDLGPEAISLLVTSADAELDVASVARQLMETALTRGLEVSPEAEPVTGMAEGPCQLATPEEIAAAAGLDGEVTFQDFEIACLYEGTTGDGHVVIYVAIQDPATFAFVIDGLGGAEIDGPGEQSWWMADISTLATRQGDLALQVTVTPDEQTDPATLQATAIAIMEALLAP